MLGEVETSESGTNAKCQPHRGMSEFGGEAENICSHGVFRILIPSRRCSEQIYLGWAYRTALRSFIRSELYHRLSGNSSASVAAELPIIRSCSVIHGSESHIGFAG